jgi:hypothetical protein
MRERNAALEQVVPRKRPATELLADVAGPPPVKKPVILFSKRDTVGGFV